jgi:putative FmdB family regulatory protein
MPIYEYRCDKCEHEFEREQRISDDPVKTCPECRSRKVKRLISQTSFVLKGGGWYSDLYSSSKGSKGDSEGKGEGKSEGKGSDKSDSSASTSDSKADPKSKTKSKAKAKSAA